MRALSFILAVGFVVASSSLAGSTDNGLPGVGTFNYRGPAITTTASLPAVVSPRI